MFNALKSFFIGNDDPEDIPEAVKGDATVPPFLHFADSLNYAAWDAENQLFHLDVVDKGNATPTGVGFVFELNPMMGASDEDMSLIMSALQTLPDHTGIQIAAYGCPNIDKFLAEYEETQKNRMERDPELGRLFSVLAKKRGDFWRTATTDTIFNGFPLRLRNYRVIISITLPDVSFDSAKNIKEAAAIRGGLMSALKAANVYGFTWQPNHLLQWTRDLLNPARMLYHKDRLMVDEYDELNPVRDQIVAKDTFLRFSNDGTEMRFGFERNGDAVCARTYSVSQYPTKQAFHLSDMSNLIGDAKQINLNYPCPFLISLSIHKGDYEKEKSATTLKSAESQRRLATPIGRYLPEMGDKAADLMMAQNSYTNGSGGMVSIMHQVILFDKPENIVASENAAKAIWRSNGFGLLNDLYLQKQSLLSILPMSMDKDFVPGLRQMKRFNTKTLLNAVSMSPLMGEWQGVGKPIIGLFGRNGQAMSLDLFANLAGNNNAAIMGTSGSGKSFLVNEFVRNYQGSNARAFVIDLGRSYQALCKFLGGQYIEFNEDSNLVINPFDMVKDIKEDRIILKLMLGTMIAPNSGINEFQTAVLEQIILALWEAKGVEATIDDVAKYLLEYRNDQGVFDPEINRLGTQLYPFTAKGIYGRWFVGKTNLDFNKDMVVLEMDDLQSKPELQKVIIQFILYRITQAMYENRAQRDIVVVDEAWTLLDGGENEAKFINEGFRKVRKYNGAFITATQNAKDYSLSKAAAAALQNADWVIALRGKEESVIELGEKLSLTEFQKSQIRSLNTLTGVYSEMFIHYPGGSGVGRLYSDPFNQLMSSSRAEDFEAIRAKEAQGMTIDLAMEAVLRDRGHILSV